MNPLEQYPEVRRIMYLAQWIVNGVIGLAGVVLVTLGESPLWFVVVTAAFNFIWSYAGMAAQGNIHQMSDFDEPRAVFGEDFEDRAGGRLRRLNPNRNRYRKPL